MSRIDRAAYRFFRGQGENAESAFKSAKDEAWATEVGLTFEWEEDSEPWNGCEPLPADCDLLWVAAKLDGEVLASLGSVAVRFRDPYIRVVEAELASEARWALEENDRKSRFGHVLDNAVAEGW